MKNYNFWTYFKKLGDVTDSNSSKSFALLVSTITGGILAVAICFILIFDVLTNGYVKTDLADLGIFLLCVGGYIAGSGVTKAISDRHKPGRPPRENNFPEDDFYNEDESCGREGRN
jgi:hypothetical protein